MWALKKKRDSFHIIINKIKPTDMTCDHFKESFIVNKAIVKPQTNPENPKITHEH